MARGTDVARWRWRLDRAVETSALCALVFVVALTFVDRSTPPATGSLADGVRGDPTVMTTAAADGLVDALEDAEWNCYDSFAAAPVTRCFSPEPAPHDLRAEVSVVRADDDTVGRVAVLTAGSDDGDRLELARSAAQLIGTHLLGGSADELAQRVGKPGVAEIAGQEVRAPSRGEAGVVLTVRAPTHVDAPLPMPELPTMRRLRAVAGSLGIDCAAPAPTLTCSAARGDGPARTMTVAGVGGRATSVTLSAASLAGTDDARVLRSLVPVVRRSGLGGASMLAWVRDHGHEPAARGDISGIHVSVEHDRSRVHSTVYLTFGGVYP